ncbi:MAG: type II 3-dehydroquinate dehydratase [Deltaproteobacteria bacterium]|nr:MAG: type II 3-dehydroquinate dehydratase [Deltaproteobacteria bacterium]
MPSDPGQPRAPALVVLHGPNLDRLGSREPEIYGTLRLSEVDAAIEAEARALGISVTCRQSNHEGQLIEWVHEADDHADGLVVNPAGYTHTSVALADALAALRIPAVEVHLSNLYARNSMRHTSLTGAHCAGVVMGLGLDGYLLAIRYLSRRLAAEAP